MQRTLVPAVALLAGFLGIGCNSLVRMYAGPPRPANEVAILWYMPEDGLKIVGIDGDVERFNGTCRADVCRVEVLPGHHRVGVLFADRTRSRSTSNYVEYQGQGVAEFDAHAGKFYTFSKHLDERDREDLDLIKIGPMRMEGDVRVTTELNLKVIEAGDPDRRFGYD